MWRDYINGLRAEWIGARVRYNGQAYNVVDVDYNGYILIDKKAEFTDTTAIDQTKVERIS